MDAFQLGLAGEEDVITHKMTLVQKILMLISPITM